MGSSLTAIFGGDANYILKLLDKGEAGIAELEAEAARLGATFGTDQVQAADKANAAMTRLWTVLEGTAGSIVSTMAPAIESFVNVSVAGAEWLASTFVAWQDTMTKVFGTVEYLVTNFGSVWDVAVKSTSYRLATIYEDTKHLFLTRMPETFLAFGGLALDTFGSITSKIGDIFSELWDYIASGGTDAIDLNLSGLVSELAADVGKGFGPHRRRFGPAGERHGGDPAGRTWSGLRPPWGRACSATWRNGWGRA